MDVALNTSHWSKHAQQWSAIGSPLRPSPEDIQILKTFLLPHVKSTYHLYQQVLILGVTPEIATLPWTKSTQVIALDYCPEMIAHIWPAHAIPNGLAICGDWRQIPLADSSCDIVVGDGCFSLLVYPDGYQAVLQSVRRVLKPQGLFAIRFFVCPSQTERLETVFEDLWAKRIGNFHIFKWRLLMALHGSQEKGVCLAEIWQKWHQAVPNPEKLIQHLDWSAESVATMNAYQNAYAYYTFPTLAQVRKIFSQYFTEIYCHFPSYELGDRCPTLLFQNP